MTRVAVLGSGSWGTGFSLVLADAGNEVTLWARRPELAQLVDARHENPDYLPGVRLPDAVRGTADAEAALHGAEVVVIAVPSQTLRDNLARWAPLLPERAVLVSLMKGIELGTTRRMTEVVAELTGAGPERIAAVSGPNLAREIAARQPAASVVACADEEVATRLQSVMMTPHFRPYTNVDVVGVELGGAVKNVIALAAGMAEGLGWGDNTKASIITRGLAETTRLGVALGAQPLTFSGLAGLGDLVATCMSPLSRNRTFGEKLGRGMTVEQIVAESRQVAEGVKSCQSILQLAQAHGVDVPIVEHVVSVVRDNVPPLEMARSLMTRSAKPEVRIR
ncbi:MAG TPA: NAD(P)H-dependent glycerol-3-phosphate dehydrogenase [Motilibacteraceae bacterium]|nr:NAD(P)H-dependent glycerol-3-phosphate dehydrogenase [Motilibacteraceae bacterium]